MNGRRVLLGTLVAAVVIGAPQVAAQAHTRAVASWPAVGEVLTQAPDRVSVLYAGDPLTDVQVSVEGPDGSALAQGEPVQEGLLVSQAMQGTADPGVYTATFEGVAADLHTIAGSFEFVVDPDGVPTGNPAGPPPVLELDDVESVEPEAVDDREESSGSGPLLLLTGVLGIAVVVAIIRVLGRRTRA